MKQISIGLLATLIGTLIVHYAKPFARVSEKFQWSLFLLSYKWHYIGYILCGILWIIGGLLIILGIEQVPF